MAHPSPHSLSLFSQGSVDQKRLPPPPAPPGQGPAQTICVPSTPSWALAEGSLLSQRERHLRPTGPPLQAGTRSHSLRPPTQRPGLPATPAPTFHTQGEHFHCREEEAMARAPEPRAGCSCKEPPSLCLVKAPVG